jgi:hypothetical protein
MTVVWIVKAVKKWCEEHEDLDWYDEASRRFGRWIHSASYGSCSELSERVEKYLGSRGDPIVLLKFFCGAIETELEYDEQTYGLLKDALRHLAETSEETIIRSHAKALIELITVAESLKSGIMCSG